MLRNSIQSFSSLRLATQLRCYTRKAVKINERVNQKPQTNARANAVPLITCKRTELNLYEGDPVPENVGIETMKLASSGWQHYKSKGDHFIIHPTIEKRTEMTNELDQIPFTSFGFNQQILQNIHSQFNITHSTHVQHAAFQELLNGEHALIAAETGCGKTLAFLLPIIENILRRQTNSPADGLGFNMPKALILTPGRELGELTILNSS